MTPAAAGSGFTDKMFVNAEMEARTAFLHPGTGLIQVVLIPRV